MLDRLTSRTHRLSGRSLQGLFALTVVLPGLLLAALGVRGWWHDRRLADQQLRARVETAADVLGRVIESDLREWMRWVESGGGAASHDRVPASLAEALSTPGNGVLVRRGPGGFIAWPAGQLAYRLDDPDFDHTPAALASAVRRAEAVELLQQDYQRAITLYRAALATTADTPLVLQRLARTLRKAGRDAEALAVYEQLARSEGRIGELPAELVARHAMLTIAHAQADAGASDAAIALHRDLVEGRWTLESSRYRFYSEDIRRVIGPPEARADVVNRLAVEARKLSLTEGAAGWFNAAAAVSPGPSTVVALHQSGSQAALLLSRDWLAHHYLPRTRASVLGDDFDVQVTDDAGRPWFDTARDQGAAPPAGTTRQLLAAGADWRLRVSPRDPVRLMADVTRRQTWSLVTLVLLVAILGSGTYLTTRVVRREMDIARQQSEFVSAVSHEFRSPLTGIRQLADMLQRGRVPDDARRQEYYAAISHESDRLSRLVEHVLDAARIEAGRKEYRFEPIDTSAWLRSVVDEARPHAACRHTRIAAAIPDALPPVLGDREALSSALHNLLDNAVKYSPGSDTVWCEAEATDERVTVRVRDSGVGMSDEDRRVVFERFRRGRHAITQAVKGTGLGLSLVDHVVRAHGGDIGCESRLGEGTTFWMHLLTQREKAGA